MTSATVHRVADDRMADGREMDANLLRSPGLRKEAQQGHRVETFDDFKARLRGAPARSNRHALAMHRVASDRLRDDAARPADAPPDECQVLLLDLSRAELRPEMRERGDILGDDQHAGRVFVEAMHDAGTLRIKTRPHSMPMMKQSADQRPAPVPRGRMHDQASGLVDNQNPVVLIDDVERNRFWLDAGGNRRGDHLDANGLSGTQERA